MKKATLILALGVLVMSCSKKETDNQVNTSDSLSADTMTSGTVPIEPDTMMAPTTPTDSSSTAMPRDSANTTR